MKPKRELPLLHLLPNFLTVGAICAGLTAIRFAFQGEYEISVGLIVLAACLDGLDGRLARLLKSESALGAELDSLADFVNFGVAPSLTLYLWVLQDSRSAGWIVVLIYAVCCVMRLARFNVETKEASTDDCKGYFTGVPAPAGALLVMMPLYISKSFGGLFIPPAFVGVHMVVAGLLMISHLPTPSLKAATIYAENVKFVVVAFVALMAALLTYPWETLSVLVLGYLLSLVWACLNKRNRTKPENGD